MITFQEVKMKQDIKAQLFKVTKQSVKKGVQVQVCLTEMKPPTTNTSEANKTEVKLKHSIEFA